MSARYSFDLKSEERRHPLPGKVIIGRKENQSVDYVLLKFLAFVLFQRERIEIEPHLDVDAIPFVPDIVQLDYEMRVRLWVECGECGVAKLHKLAVKVPEAEIWVLKRSRAEAEDLFRAMAKEGLRRDRYGLVGFEAEMFDEMTGLLGSRNALTWIHGTFEPPHLQFDFNGLWFDTAFTVLKF